MPNRNHKTHLRNMAARYAGLKAKGLCPGCGKRKPKKRRVKCVVCLRRALSYWKRNRAKVADYQTQARAELRNKIFTAYGKVCECCGEDHLEFLTIDHINGNGASHRRKLGAGRNIYRWLRDKGFPKGFRTLCINCNFSRGVHGYCPHEKGRGHDKQIRRRTRRRQGKKIS